MGVTYFDTAPSFAGYGKAQQQLGYLLKHRRKDVFLVTKCWEPRGKAALKLLQQSLRELQTDYVDLVFVHSIGSDKMDYGTVFGRNGCYAAMKKAKANERANQSVLQQRASLNVILCGLRLNIPRSSASAINTPITNNT